MTFKELLEQLQKLPPEALEGQADVLDSRTNKFTPVLSIYNEPKGFPHLDKSYYTFITIKSKE